jgi:hypothetical protein
MEPEVSMMRPVVSCVQAFLVAMLAVVSAGWPTHALSPEDERSSTRSAPAASSPLLDALAFASPDTISFEFTDWTVLKALHGGSDITSASPLEDRQRLVLDMVHSEASQFDFGLDRLATWPELWGWDNTDLAWEATWFPFDVRVLRFREGWDSVPFIDRLEALGYSRTDDRYGSFFSDPPDFSAGSGGEAVLDADELLLAASRPPSVAISNDGRTVAIREGDRADKLLSIAARADPVAVAASPFGRVAVALGRPVTALLVDGDYACSEVGPGNADFLADIAVRPPSVGPLRPYQAFGIGYERAGGGEPAVGRYTFAYERAKQATADLADRRTLIDEGYASRSGRPPEEVALASGDAAPDRRTLILDVDMLDDAPQLLFDLLFRPSVSPVACG